MRYVEVAERLPSMPRSLANRRPPIGYNSNMQLGFSPKGWWARQDLNLHGLRHGILSPACLPFHHSPEYPNQQTVQPTPLTSSVALRFSSGKCILNQRSRPAAHGAEGCSARPWTAPALWSFGNGGELDGKRESARTNDKWIKQG